jgi:hypothetical protein
MLHSIPDWKTAMPDLANALATFPPKILAKWANMRDASAVTVVPIKHEIKIEAAP